MLKEKAIVALDFDSAPSALNFLIPLQGQVKWVKVGLELFVAEGPQFLKLLNEQGFDIFLDLKLHDIPKTVEKSLNSIAKLPVKLTTVHYSCGPAFFASITKNSYPFKILGVTALTSLTDEEIKKIYGGGRSAHSLVQDFISQSLPFSHPDGCICSGQELDTVKSLISDHINSYTIVCPGVRFSQEQAHDQARITHPFETLKSGASFVVIGRELTLAKNPIELWEAWSRQYETFKR